MRRIWLAVVLCLSLILVAPATGAQQAGKVHRIGALAPFSASDGAPYLEAFRQGLRDLGDVEGQNIAIEWRGANGKAERFPDLANELVRLRVDMILATNNPAIAAAQRATSTIPIVMVLATDPVGAGFVASLARPGGNITGLSSQFAELGPKRLQLLREAVPTLSRVAILWDPTEPGRREEMGVIELTARASGLRVQRFEARSPNEIGRAFASLSRESGDALVVQGTSMLFDQRAPIAEHAIKRRLPAICAIKAFVKAGCLMSYSASLIDVFRRAAGFVHKIRTGVTPADLPVEQPTKFELVINLKTAKTLGLPIPQSLLVRGDEIIH